MTDSAYILDTETSGTDPAVDQVIELAWQRARDPGRPINPCAFYAQYKPTAPITLGALATHHILESDLVDCPSANLAHLDAPAMAEYWIGHNIDFDWRMLKSPDVKRICTLALARFLLPELDTHTQSALIYHIGMKLGQPERARERLLKAHNAKADVENCATVFTYLMQVAKGQGTDVSSWEAIHALSEYARVPSTMQFGKWKGSHVCDVDPGYRDWYRKQTDQDPYVLKAFELYRFGDKHA